MKLKMRERKKLTMVKAQVYLKAGKTKKSAMLDDFCESTGYCRRHAAWVLHQAGQRYLLGKCILVADSTKHLHRHHPPVWPCGAEGTDHHLERNHLPRPCVRPEAWHSPRRTSSPMDISIWMTRHGGFSSR